LTATISPLAKLPGPTSKVLGFDLFQQTKLDYLGHVERLKTQFGDVVMSQVVHEKIVDIHHPELIRELLVDNADALIRWERGIEVFTKLHGKSVLITEGETWKRQRRMLQPGFGIKRMEGYSALMVNTTEKALGALGHEPMIDIEFEQWAHQLTMDVIVQTLFGSSTSLACPPVLRDSAIAAVATLSRHGMAELFWPYSAPDWMPHKADKRRAKKVLDDLICNNIRLRRSEPQSPMTGASDVLGMLMSVRDESGDGAGLTDEEIKDQCMTIFLAGHDTTATALTWWAWLMAKHPEAAQCAQAQIDTELAGHSPRFEDIARLPYITNSIKEALRLYPPASALLSRRTLRDVKLGPWTIPKGAMVRMTPWVVHRDARWFPEPTRFDPDRFNGENSALHRQSFMPFGTGPRVCIGSQFALTEMTLIAVHLLQRFSFHALSDPKPQFNVLLSPKDGMPLRLVRRLSSNLQL
jgi:cytochrome P450